MWADHFEQCEDFLLCLYVNTLQNELRFQKQGGMALSKNWPTAASCGLHMVKGMVQAEAIQLQSGRMAVDGFNIVAAAVG